jgi:predicted DCC family thiol-disulfide oxidoreductase YuxK
MLFKSLFLLLIVCVKSSISLRTSSFLKTSKSFHNLILKSSIASNNNLFDKIDLLYDSECPICQMEGDFLKKRDIDNRIRFTDLSSANYNPDEHGHIQFEEGMRKLHAILPDGRIVRGVEVFRQTYDAIGLGWVLAATSLPGIGQIADILYDLWAEHRLRLTGRTEVADILKQRAEELREMEMADCDRDGCAIDF